MPRLSAPCESHVRQRWARRTNVHRDCAAARGDSTNVRPRVLLYGAGALRGVPQDDGAADDRRGDHARRGDAARGRAASAAGDALDQRRWWVVAAAIGLWLGRRNAPSAAIARLLGGRQGEHCAAAAAPAAVRDQPAVAAARARPSSRAALALLAPQVPASAPASRSSGRSPGAASTPRWLRSRSATACASTSCETSPLRPIALQPHAGVQGRAPCSRTASDAVSARGGPAAQPVDVLLVSLGSTGGLRDADAELARASSARARASRSRPRRRRGRCGRSCSTDLALGAAPRARAAREALRRARPRRDRSTQTTHRGAARAGARARSASTRSRRATGPGATASGSARSSARVLRARAVAAAGERGGARRDCARPAAAPAVVVLPIAVEPSGARRGERDIAAITYAAEPAQEGPRPRARGVGGARAATARSWWSPGGAPTLGAPAEACRDGRGPLVGALPAMSTARCCAARASTSCAPRREEYGIAQLEALADGAMLVTRAARRAPTPRSRSRARSTRGSSASDLASAVRTALDDPRAGDYAAARRARARAVQRGERRRVVARAGAAAPACGRVALARRLSAGHGQRVARSSAASSHAAARRPDAAAHDRQASPASGRRSRSRARRPRPRRRARGPRRGRGGRGLELISSSVPAARAAAKTASRSSA